MVREQYLGYWVVNWRDNQGVWWVAARRVGRNCNEWRQRHCVDLDVARAWVREQVGVAEAGSEPAQEREPAPTAEQMRVFSELMALAIGTARKPGPPADVVMAFGVLHLGEVTRNEEAIKVAYRKMAKVWHPDSGGDESEFLRLKSAFDKAMEWACTAG